MRPQLRDTVRCLDGAVTVGGMGVSKPQCAAVTKRKRGIVFHLLLVLLGVSLAEVSVRACGVRPWFRNPAEAVRDAFMEPDPVLGWRLRPRADGAIWTGPKAHTESILPDHTRVVVPTPIEPTAPTVLVLGDSSIFGWGLDDDKTFASALARKVPHVRVVNGAVPGYGALQSLLWMERLFATYRPSAVILGYSDYFFERDTGALGWATLLARLSVRNNCDLPYAALRQGSLDVTPPRPYFLELPARHTLAIAYLLEQAIALVRARPQQQHAQQIAVTREIFRRWSAKVAEHGAVPMVLLWNNDSSETLFASYLRELRVHPLPCVHPQQGEPVTLLPADGHPSALVTEYWAECVVRQVEARLFQAAQD